MKSRSKYADISRRKFIASAGIAGLGSLCAIPASVSATAAEPEKPAGSLFKTKPYLQAPLPESITIKWITTEATYSWVEFGDAPDQLDRSAHTEVEGLVQANNTIHTIKLTGLAPGKKYYYQACSKSINLSDPYKIKYGETEKSRVLSFNTVDPDNETVTFTVLNDIHDRPASFGTMLNDVAGNPKADFLFLNGDMFDYQIDENQIVDHLLQPLAGLADTGTPFIFSRGNHETRGQFARHIGEYFDGYSDKYYFSFQAGPMYAIVLDSGEDKEDSDKSYAGLSVFDKYRVEQARWLEKEIQKKAFKKARYKVVFSHIPLYYSDPRWPHGSDHCRQVWGPILNKARIDLLISGHVHIHGVHPAVPGEHNYPIVIGGGPNNGKRTVMIVKADRNSLELNMLDDRGNNVGRVKI